MLIINAYGSQAHVPKIDQSLFTLADTEPVISKDQMLFSQLCTESQFNSTLYQYWCDQIKEKKRTHRKQWEFVYILQALNERGMIKQGKIGVGFGVGQEPLPALFAKNGVKVLATDLGSEEAAKKGWAQSSQHLESFEKLNRSGIVDMATLKKLVSIAEVDMNNIPSTIRSYDFTWSSCSLEHLGSIENGLRFIENSLKTLKPGGVAVHTTEYNLSSNNETLESGGTVIFRKKDIELLVKRLTEDGHEVYVNYNPGSGVLDAHIDIPPYNDNKHIILQLSDYVTTSLGLIIRKKLD